MGIFKLFLECRPFLDKGFYRVFIEALLFGCFRIDFDQIENLFKSVIGCKLSGIANDFTGLQKLNSGKRHPINVEKRLDKKAVAVQKFIAFSLEKT